MTSLVTGGAGFIGSHVAEHLMKSGHRVVVLDDLSGGFAENIPRGVELFARASILNHRYLNDLFARFKFDYVFHLAAYAAEGLSPFVKRFNYENNLVGSVNLINASVNHDVACFVFLSSIAVYGRAQVPFTEDMRPEPDDSYGIAKLAVEQELAITKARFGLDYVIFRGHNIYGERQNIGDPYRNVVGVFMNSALKGEPFPIFGDGEQVRAFTYIGDVAPVIAEAASFRSASLQTVYNIGTSETHTVSDLARAVADAMGVPVHVKTLASRGEPQVAYPSHERAERLFGPCKTTLDTGLARMAAWAKQHGARESTPFNDMEIRKNLPEAWR